MAIGIQMLGARYNTSTSMPIPLPLGCPVYGPACDAAHKPALCEPHWNGRWTAWDQGLPKRSSNS